MTIIHYTKHNDAVFMYYVYW